MPDDPRSWIHPLDCRCPECEAHRPADPGRSTTHDMLGFAGLGLFLGHSIVFAIDPDGAWWALTDALAQLLGR